MRGCEEAKMRGNGENGGCRDAKMRGCEATARTADARMRRGEDARQRQKIFAVIAVPD